MPFQDHGRKMRPSQMWHGGFFLPMAPHPVTSSRSILKKDDLSAAYPTSCPCNYSSFIRYGADTNDIGLGETYGYTQKTDYKMFTISTVAPGLFLP